METTTGYFKVRLVSRDLAKYMVDNISPCLRIGLENYLSFNLIAHMEIMFRKQHFEDLMHAIKSVKIGNIARNDLLIKSDFLKCCLRDLRETGSPKANLAILGYLMGSVSVVNGSNDWQKFDNCLVKVHKLIVDNGNLSRQLWMLLERLQGQGYRKRFLKEIISVFIVGTFGIRLGQVCLSQG
ncbi:hypothetical protein Tco_0704351 [Tanacetum coccineum]|uniref:Uncharacterized protein n=1 Tax=Tanacetum coccineum TaxID=301880 RepID=A0ABQ4Y2C7_9ASTR